MMKIENYDFDVKNLCSRKLWEILKDAEWQTENQKMAIEGELSSRKHYLDELSTLQDNSSHYTGVFH
jgi:hypothetical protein